MAASGYSTLYLNTNNTLIAALAAESPNYASHLPTGYTTATIYSLLGAELFIKTKQMLVESPQCYRNKVEYLAQIYDSSELAQFEVYTALWLLFEKCHGEMFNDAIKYKQLATEWLSSHPIQWDDTVSVTESDINTEKRFRFTEVIVI